MDVLVIATTSWLRLLLLALVIWGGSTSVTYPASAREGDTQGATESRHGQDARSAVTTSVPNLRTATLIARLTPQTPLRSSTYRIRRFLAAKGVTKTDRIKEHVTQRDLDAARRELNGEVVARQPDGTPFDHVGEVRDAQRGLLNRVDVLKRRLGRGGLTQSDRAGVEAELGEASRLLDRTEGYVPR